MNTHVPTVLRSAAQLIRENGWYRGFATGQDRVRVAPDGSTSRPNGAGPGSGYCVATAVSQAALLTEVDDFASAEREAMAALATTLGTHVTESGYANNGAIWRRNDSQPLDTGWQWALDTLELAATQYAVRHAD